MVVGVVGVWLVVRHAVLQAGVGAGGMREAWHRGEGGGEGGAGEGNLAQGGGNGSTHVVLLAKWVAIGGRLGEETEEEDGIRLSKCQDRPRTVAKLGS